MQNYQTIKIWVGWGSYLWDTFKICDSDKTQNTIDHKRRKLCVENHSFMTFYCHGFLIISNHIKVKNKSSVIIALNHVMLV